jgi:adenylate kinase
MRLLMVGPPGAGKGTQGVRIAELFGITHISSGDLLRRHIAEGTSIGQAAQAYVRQGDLVPDAIVMDMLYKPVTQATAEGGYVLDGFPRTVEQAEFAYQTAKEVGAAIQAAIYLDVPRDELIRRLLSRHRGEEDTEEIINHRLDVYDKRTVPLLDYYADRETLVSVDGGLPIDAVTKSIEAELLRAKATFQD